MNLAWQLPLRKLILTDWICDENSSFYPETVISNKSDVCFYRSMENLHQALAVEYCRTEIFLKNLFLQLRWVSTPILFNILIISMGSGTESTLTKFGDDIKLRGAVKHPDGRAPIQRDLSKAEARADRRSWSSAMTDVNAATGPGQLSAQVQPGDWVAAQKLCQKDLVVLMITWMITVRVQWWRLTHTGPQ